MANTRVSGTGDSEDMIEQEKGVKSEKQREYSNGKSESGTPRTSVIAYPSYHTVPCTMEKKQI